MKPAGRDVHTQHSEDPADLADRDAERFVQLRGKRDRPRPDLRTGRPQRVAGLLAVASLHAPAAAPAAPAADPKVPHMPADPAHVVLVLIDLVLELKLARTARARLGQPDADLLIDTVGDRPLRPRAVLLAAAASRLGRVLLGLALGERGRLTLARPPRLLKLPAQPLVLGQQPVVAGAQPDVTAITTQTLAHTPSTSQATCRSTLHTCKIPCKQQESSAAPDA